MAKILRAMRQNGSPDPVFETDAERLYFLTTLPIHPRFARQASLTQRAIPDSATRAHVPNPQNGSTRRDNALDLSDGERRVLAYLSSNPEATIAQAAFELGMSASTVGRNIGTLKLAGLLAREGSARTGRWVVRPEE